MERRPSNIPFGEARIRVTKANDGAEVEIEMSCESFDAFIADTARKRSLTIAGAVGEALRLERLFSDTANDPNQGLYLAKRGHRPREIVSV